MAIGTSLGAYFEDDFSHQAGIETPPEVMKPKDTGDDNVAPPDPESQGKEGAIKIRPVSDAKSYDTKLTEGEEKKFQEWKGQNAPNDSGEDYDLRGAYKAGLTKDIASGHWPDTYKKPNHETFSDESIYAKDRPDLAGSWTGENHDQYSPTATRMAVDASRKAVDALKRGQGTAPTSDVDTGIEGEVHMKSPYVTITDEDIDKGMSLGMGFAGGGFHATLDGLGLLSRLGGKISTSADGIPATVHLQGEGHAALQEGPDVFQQFMASRGRNQPSNIVDHPVESGHPMDPVAASNHYHALTNSNRPRDAVGFAHEYEEHASPAQWEVYERHVNDLSNHPETMRQESLAMDHHSIEQRPFDPTPGGHITQGRHPDTLSDQDFYHWGEYQPENGMTPEQEHRWLTLDEEAGRTQRAEPPHWEDNLQHDIEENEAMGGRLSQRRVKEVKDKFVNNPTLVKKGNISMVRDPSITSTEDRQFYNFLSDEGIPGELTVRLRDGGKDVHVSWIGTIGSDGPLDVGHTEMKNLFKLLAAQYPKAREISGFRVSGARSEVGSVGEASMKIPGRNRAPVIGE